jgi:hypothetical protein
VPNLSATNYTVTSFSPGGLLNSGATYYWKVIAKNGTGSSPDSAVWSFSTTAASGFTPIRVNSGGPAYTDTAGNAWAADTNTSGSPFSTTASIGGTNDPALYQTERFNSATFGYTFTVPNGNYTVKLKFAEIYFTTCGNRIFNVAINTATVDTNFDPCAVGGGPNIAVDRSYTVTVTGAQIAISVIPVVQNPTISAIEITSGGATSSPSVSGLSCSPNSVASGGNSNCTVTLSSAASTGGVSVGLASNNSALSVPASVTVASGATTATITATAGTVTSTQTATVTATLNGTASAVVTVTPPSSTLVLSKEYIRLGGRVIAIENH